MNVAWQIIHKRVWGTPPTVRLTTAIRDREPGYKWPSTADGYGWKVIPAGKGYVKKVRCDISLQTSYVGFWRMQCLSDTGKKALTQRISSLSHDSILEATFTDDEIDCVYSKYMSLMAAYPPNGDGRRQLNDWVRRQVYLRQVLSSTFSTMETRRNPQPPPTTTEQQNLAQLISNRPAGYPWPCNRYSKDLVAMKCGWATSKIGHCRAALLGEQHYHHLLSSIESLKEDSILEINFSDNQIDILYYAWQQKEATLCMTKREDGETRRIREKLATLFLSMELRRLKEWK